jgi:hypothetical protein
LGDSTLGFLIKNIADGFPFPTHCFQIS